MTPATPAGGGRYLAAPVFIASLLAFAGTLTGGALYFRDIALLHRPTRMVVRAIWAAGALPLWEARRDGGRALLANPNHRVLHPTALLDVVLSLDAAFAVAAILQVFLAGWGLALLLRDRGLSPGAARIGGLAFALSGPLLSLGNLPNLMAGIAWVPLALWAGSRAMERPLRWLPLAAGLTAVPYLAGGVESVAVIGAVLLGDALLMRGRWRRVLAAGSTLVLATLLAAVQILPAMAVLRGSERGMGLRPVQVVHWSMAPVRLVEALLPGLWGNPTDHSAWWGASRFDDGLPLILSTYVGPVVLLLALVGAVVALRRRRGDHDEGDALALDAPLCRLLAVTAAVGAGAVFMALGRYNPLLAVDGALPMAGVVLRYPERLLPFAVLPVAIAAAAGVEVLVRRRAAAQPLPAVFWVGFGGLSLALVASAGLALLGRPPVAWLLESPLPDTVARAAPPALASSAAALATLGLVAACVGLAGGGRHPGRATALAAVVLVADLLMPGLQLNPTVSREQLTLRPDMADLLLDEDTAGAADVRVYRWPDPEIRGESLAAGAEVRWGRESLSNLVPQEFAIGTALSTEVDRSSPLGTAVLRMAHAAATGARRERLADRAAANWELGFVNGTTPGARRPTHTITTSVAGAPRVALWARPGAAARVSVVPTGIDMGELNRPGALPALVERLGDPASNPSVEVFLSGSHGEQVAGTWEPGEGSAVIARELPGNLAVDVEVPGPALLVVRDAMVTGWRATLDGASAPVVRADLAWRAVQLPPGRHQVVFTYHQPGLAAGGLLSVAGLLICTALLVGSRREYRRQRTLQESAVAAAQQAA